MAEERAGWEPGSPQRVAAWPAGTDASPLAVANRQGERRAADVHVARAICRLGSEERPGVLEVVARLVAAARDGSSCVVVDPAEAQALASSPLVRVADGDAPGGPPGSGRPLWLAGDLLYLDRFWRDENLVARQVRRRAETDRRVDLEALRDSLGRFAAPAPDRQRVATALAVLRGLTVIAGGPGTGKTTTVARIIAALSEQPGPAPRVALAAPTGKAAARLQESIAAQTGELGLAGPFRAVTIHRLLGYRPGSRPRHRRQNPLPHDVVIVDETSMVSLPLLARVLDAVRPDARLILLGDPDQLASVDVGAVLADLVARPGPAAVDPRLELVVGDDLSGPDGAEVSQAAARGVVRLDRGYRNEPDIALLARAVQDGDAAAALAVLRDPCRTAVELIEIDEGTDLSDAELTAVRDLVVAQGEAVTQAARASDAAAALEALGRHQILVAHRSGPFGAGRWSAAAEKATAAAHPDHGTRGGAGPDWYVGRPVVVTRNDDDTGLANGDVGVAVHRSGTAGQADLRVAFDTGEVRLLHPGRLPEHLPLQAITVHRAQGSQYDAVTVVLPEPQSALLTRELLYTAITRARGRVIVVGSADSVSAAVERPAQRASGLRRVEAWERAGRDT